MKMKNKLLFSLLLIWSLFCFAGCGKELIEEGKRKDIIALLEENYLIDTSWEYIDVVYQYANVMYLDNDVTGYDYIYQDTLGQYHTVEIDVMNFKNDDEYGNVAVKTGVEYYRVNIMECDYIVETKEKDNGTTITTRKVNHKYDNAYETYLLYYKSSKIIIEPVL